MTRALLAGLLALHGAAHAGSAVTEWTFRALLDDQPIGTHRYTLQTEGDERTVRSDARFAVKVLGITAYHYRHAATEHWRGDCLTRLSATTDDDGKPNKVHLEGAELKGCVMSFAYWNPKIEAQTRLLNAQTGRLEEVRVEALGEGQLSVRGTPTPAVRWRINGLAAPIDVWYSTRGEWIGLDSTVAGGRKLSYRLE
jgi:hypothetical protein